MKLPSALNATSLCGFHVQPSWSCVPPTAVTYGLEAGQPVVGNEYVVVFLACLVTPSVPSSPDDAKNVSPLAIPFWNTASNLAVWFAAAPPNVCSVTPKLIEKTVPDGFASIWSLIALNRFGKPWTPSVSAGGTPISTMCASGAIAYDHSMSRFASPAQPSAPADPDLPLPTFLKSGWPFG